MPRPPSVSPVTGRPVPADYIHSSSLHFQDTHGRSLLLRGVNLSGSAKAPVGKPSWKREGFWEEAEAGGGNFNNRPLNLEDGSADVHLARLRAWGFNMLRYVFTWESLEHEGPGKYDYAYMDYIIAVLKKCKEWGFRVFMDPHQDVWSRFTGGSGSPLWTLYACGIDPSHITPTAAAYIHCEWPDADNPKPEEFPAMIWGTNYTRLACQTIWTLFFAGKTYAPKCIIDGKNIQDYLQGHYIDAVGTLAKRIADNAPELYDTCIIGWDSMNEVGEGLIGHPDLSKIPDEQQLKKGPTPTPIQGMRLGMGEAVQVQEWGFGGMGPYRGGHILIDPKGTRLWLSKEDDMTRGGGKWGWTRGEEWEMGTCIWAQHGVWDIGSGELLRPDHFTKLPSDPSHTVDFVADFFSIHWLAYASQIRIHHPEAIHFIQAPVMHPPPKIPESFLKGRACASPHFYDGLTLMTKHWNWFNADAVGVMRKKYWSIVQAVRVGEKNIRNMVQGELGVIKADTAEVLGQYPTLIGEIGIPYDMDGKKAYGYVDGGRGEGDYSSQQRALDCSLNACDGPNCLNYTTWTYVPDNTHEWGDLWNGEDLSLWSSEDADDERYSDSAGNSRSTTPIAGRGQQSSASTSSTSSSATLTATPATKTSPVLSLSTIQAGDLPSSLVTSGARALPAFCRPYPFAMVGTPEKIEFDIASTTFKLSIKVGADDKVTKELATEIYVPFAHYAANLASGKIDGERSTISSRNTSQVDLVNANVTEGKSRTTKMDPSYISIRSAASTSPLALDIDVKVSHGRYETTGQTLRWYYDAPPSASDGEGIYTIEIKRKGGAMRRDLGYVQQGSWSDVCPSACVIA